MRFTLFFVLLFTSITHANTNNWYRVEMLVFETKDKHVLAQEWSPVIGKPSLSDAVPIQADPQAAFGRIPEKNLTLNEIKQKLKKNYTLVSHQGWRQIITDKTHAQKVRVTGGQTGHNVEGMIKLSGENDLHLDTDLLFQKTMKKQKNQSQIQTLRLQDSTRIRANEIQYLDHPVYGVIVMVIPESKA